MKEKLQDNMIGKICLVTGATNGIGKATAQALAQMGATVVIVGRNPAKCAAVVSEIKQISGNHAVEALSADLSIMAEVRQVAEQFKAKYQRLHVLVNNAGAAFGTRQLTSEGFEKTFALNHLSYFLLTNLLLDTLKASVGTLLGEALVGSSYETLADGRLFTIPWTAIGLIVLIAYGSSLLTTILPALQASRIYPAEALRYE